MTLAHIGGVPFEEWVMPLLAGAYGTVVGVRATVRALTQRVRRSP